MWRYYSRDFLAETFGVEYKGTNIIFPDYCQRFDNEPVYNITNDCLKMMCTYSDPDNALVAVTDGFDRLATIDEIITEFDKQNVSYHIDFYFWNPNSFQENRLRLIEKKYDSVSVFFHIPHEEYVKKLACYDYFVVLRKKGKIPIWPEYDARCYSEGNHKYSVCSRYIESIAVGTPVVSTAAMTQCDILEKDEVLIKMHLKNISLSYLKENRKSYKMNVRKKRHKYYIENHIDELILFIKDIVAN